MDGAFPNLGRGELHDSIECNPILRIASVDNRSTRRWTVNAAEELAKAIIENYDSPLQPNPKTPLEGYPLTLFKLRHCRPIDRSRHAA
jgi:hypothetical protein